MMKSEDYYSIRIVFLLMFKLLEESNNVAFKHFMNLVEGDFSDHQDFKFLKYSYHMKKLQNNTLNRLTTFLESYDSHDDRDVLFSKKCTQSLFGAYLFWGGILDESRQVFEEIKLNGKNAACFFNKQFIYDCLSISNGN